MIEIANRRILLVGGAGFIGHNLALRLKELGADVHIVDSLQVNNLYAFGRPGSDTINKELYIRIINQRLDMLRDAGVPVHLQDARDYGALTFLFRELKPQTVVQLAAVSHANRSNKDPYSTFDHSFRTLENALDCSRDIVEHFIYLSSSMIYGNFATGTVDETTPCEPIGIYGALKFSGEKLVIAYNQVFNLPYTIIRPSALYGERCISRRIGQIFIENALQGIDVTVHGDGLSALDFTYIGDFVSGMVNVIENENSHNEIFNLTYGAGRTLSELADTIKKHFPEVTVKYLEKDNLMPERGTLSVEKAKKMIGYAPQFPLEKGIERYVKWYRSLNWPTS